MQPEVQHQDIGLCCDGHEQSGMQTFPLKQWMTPWGDGMVYRSWRLEQVTLYRHSALRDAWCWPGKLPGRAGLQLHA